MIHPRAGVLAATLIAAAGSTGCEDVVAEQSWTSFSVVEVEATEPGGTVPVSGVTVRLSALGLDCDDLHPDTAIRDSVRTGIDGLAVLGLSVESGPVGAACVGLDVRAPEGHALEGPTERSVPVAFVIRGQQPPGRLELILVPDPSS